MIRTRIIRLKCADCPKRIYVPARGGCRYCAKCLARRTDAKRAQRIEAKQRATVEQARSYAAIRRREKQPAPLSIFDRERIILGWMREA